MRVIANYSDARPMISKTTALAFAGLSLIVLAGCQTTENALDGGAPAAKATVVSSAPAAASGELAAYRPVDGERFTFALVTHGRVPAKHLQVIKDAVAAGLAENGKLAVSGEAVKQVEILFTDYRMRAPGLRQLVGSFAGKDRVETMVHIKGSGSGEILSSRFLRTGSASGWRGIGTILKRHAKKVVKYVARGK
jgi:hypothetical protein